MPSPPNELGIGVNSFFWVGGAELQGEETLSTRESVRDFSPIFLAKDVHLIVNFRMVFLLLRRKKREVGDLLLSHLALTFQSCYSLSPRPSFSF